MEIKRAGSRPSGKGPAEWFTGTVRIDPLFAANAPARAAGNAVTFEPGARTAWHTHPLGQTLIVTAGLVLGSLLGELVASLLPTGLIHDLLTRGPQIGLTPPATLDLRFVAPVMLDEIVGLRAAVLVVVVGGFVLRRGWLLRFLGGRFCGRFFGRSRGGRRFGFLAPTGGGQNIGR